MSERKINVQRMPFGSKRMETQRMNGQSFRHRHLPSNTHLGRSRVLARGRKHHSSPLVGLGDWVILHRHAAVLRLHRRVAVDAELSHKAGENPEESALVEET